MLGKLIRYDFKRQWKLLGVAYGISSIMGIGVALLRLLADYTDILALRYVTVAGTVFCGVAAVVLIVGTWIYALLYFRSNLLKDEGYLMHTLPAKPEQLYISKLITFIIYVALSIVVAYLCIAMAMGNARLLGDVFRQMTMELPETGTRILMWSVAYVVVMGIITMIIHLGCLVLGYTWRFKNASAVNRDLLSVGIYLVLHFVIQIASVVMLLVYLLVKYGNFISQIEVLDQAMNQAASAFETEIYSYITGVMGISAVTYLVVGVVMLVVSLRRLRLNLDLQ